LPFSTPFAWGAVFTASQDFLFLFFLICPYPLHKSFTMADITFSAPHRTFFALHQQLPVSAANYYRNAFLYSFFKCIFVAIF
jgi:hypothetical protein